MHAAGLSKKPSKLLHFFIKPRTAPGTIVIEFGLICNHEVRILLSLLACLALAICSALVMQPSSRDLNTAAAEVTRR